MFSKVPDSEQGAALTTEQITFIDAKITELEKYATQKSKAERDKFYKEFADRRKLPEL